MNKTIRAAGIFLAVFCTLSFAQNSDTFNANEPFVSDGVVNLTQFNFGSMGNVLVDNGPLINGVGTGSGGADESILQSTSLNMTSIGLTCSVAAGFRLADDFTLNEDATITDIIFFAYQTGSTTTSSFTAINLRIWDGVPDMPGSNILFGDTTTNLLSNTEFSNIFRVTETTGMSTARPIMASTATFSVDLPAGTYFLDWQLDASLASGPFCPPITIAGQTTTGDAFQSDAAGTNFVPANDGGTLTTQGFPFMILGSTAAPGPVISVPATSTWSMILLTMALLMLAAWQFRRHQKS